VALNPIVFYDFKSRCCPAVMSGGHSMEDRIRGARHRAQKMGAAEASIADSERSSFVRR
jgi:hypothetical protein